MIVFSCQESQAVNPEDALVPSSGALQIKGWLCCESQAPLVPQLNSGGHVCHQRPQFLLEIN